MKLPIEERNQILSVAAAEAADEYENNKELTDFEAFDDFLEYDDYRITGINVNWKRARELWKKLQAVIKKEDTHEV